MSSLYKGEFSKVDSHQIILQDYSMKGMDFAQCGIGHYWPLLYLHENCIVREPLLRIALTMWAKK